MSSQNKSYFGENYGDVLKRASENGKLHLGNTRDPKFCEVIRDMWVRKENPLRDGYFVDTTYHGELICYKLTDGKGKFWECEVAHAVYVGINPLESK